MSEVSVNGSVVPITPYIVEYGAPTAVIGSLGSPRRGRVNDVQYGLKDFPRVHTLLFLTLRAETITAVGAQHPAKHLCPIVPVISEVLNTRIPTDHNSDMSL